MDEKERLLEHINNLISNAYGVGYKDGQASIWAEVERQSADQ